MLVLVLVPGDALRIGEDVVVKVMEKSGRRFKVAIDAPKSVRVRRDGSKKIGEIPS